VRRRIANGEEFIELSLRPPIQYPIPIGALGIGRTHRKDPTRRLLGSWNAPRRGRGLAADSLPPQRFWRRRLC
jgi:hypothetical protein